MEKDIDVIVVCGGKGSRMKNLSKKFGCKSLIQIKGNPIIEYSLRTINEVLPSSKIILVIDDPKLKQKFEKICKKLNLENYFIYEGLPRGPVQAFYEAGSFCKSSRVLILFGNQLISKSHLKKMLTQEKELMVFSGFKSLSENNCKIAKVDKNSFVLDVSRYDCLVKLKKYEVYLDVPYLVPNSFFSMETFPEIKRLFVKTPMDKIELKNKKKIKVEMSDLPPEFHFEEELEELEKYKTKLN